MYLPATTHGRNPITFEGCFKQYTLFRDVPNQPQCCLSLFSSLITFRRCSFSAALSYTHRHRPLPKRHKSRMEDIPQGADETSVDAQGNPEASQKATFCDESGRKRKSVWFDAWRDDPLLRLLVGNNNSEAVCVPRSSLCANPNLDSQANGGQQDPILVTPLREVTENLPFALRFVLEIVCSTTTLLNVRSSIRHGTALWRRTGRKALPK